MESFSKFLTLISAGTLLFGISACENVTSLTGPNGVSGACTPGKAQLAVYDGFIQNLCGCQEPEEVVMPPASLTCTVPAGTTVWFWYISTTQFHQIQSTANPTFPTSPLNDPNASNPVKTHVVTLKDPGNYEFQDVYNRAVNGTIVVF
jgi:plastocyanin